MQKKCLWKIPMEIETPETASAPDVLNFDPEGIDLAKFDRDSIVEMMKTSIDIMGAVCLPDVVTEYFPAEYQYLWRRYTEALMDESKAFPKFGLGLPRGHGKTMFIKLLIVFAVLFTSRKYILSVCASDTLAEDIVVDFSDIMDSPNIISLFGNWRAYQERDKIGYLKFKMGGHDRIVKGLGQNASFRGTNIKNNRPDFMIFDDSQTLDNAMSPAAAQKFQRRFYGTMLKAKSNKRCMYLFVGNMYPNTVLDENPKTGQKIYGCLLRNLKESASWETLIVGAILSNGTALWEKVQSLEQILSEFVDDFRSGNAHVFASEVLNDPDYSLLKLFDPSRVPEYEYYRTEENGIEPLAKYIIVDPSLGKKSSDDQVLGLFYVYDNVPVLKEIRIVQESSPMMAKALLLWAFEENVPVAAIEDYAMQGVIIQWLNFWLKQVQIPDFQVVGISRGAETKNGSIIAMFKALMDGSLVLHPKVKSRVYDQIMEFDPTVKNNRDDILDVCAYGPKFWVEKAETAFMKVVSGDYDDDPEKSGVMDAGLYIGVG